MQLTRPGGSRGAFAVEVEQLLFIHAILTAYRKLPTLLPIST